LRGGLPTAAAPGRKSQGIIFVPQQASLEEAQLQCRAKDCFVARFAAVPALESDYRFLANPILQRRDGPIGDDDGIAPTRFELCLRAAKNLRRTALIQLPVPSGK
jgi:hypothetical protein